MIKLVLALTILSSVFAIYSRTSDVFVLSEVTLQTKIFDDQRIGFVNFYRSSNPQSVAIKQEYEKAANALANIITVAAIDLDQDDVSAAYGITEVPTVRFYLNKKEYHPFNGEYQSKELVLFAFEQVKRNAFAKAGFKIKSGDEKKKDSKKDKKDEKKKEDEDVEDPDVVVLDENNFDDIVLASKEAWFIEFYAPWCGHCKELKPHYAKLATKLIGSGVKVGKIDSSSKNKKLAEAYNATHGFPTLKFINKGDKIKGFSELYDGARELDSLYKFALEAKERLRIPKKEQLLSDQHFKEECVSRLNLCFIMFLPHILDSSAEERNRYLDIYESVVSKQVGKPFSFFWSQGGDQYELEDQFRMSGAGYPSFVVYSSKKSFYSIMRSTISEDNINKFLDKLVKGKEQVQQFRGSLKIVNATPWNGEDAH